MTNSFITSSKARRMQKNSFRSHWISWALKDLRGTHSPLKLSHHYQRNWQTMHILARQNFSISWCRRSIHSHTLSWKRLVELHLYSMTLKAALNSTRRRWTWRILKDSLGQILIKTIAILGLLGMKSWTTMRLLMHFNKLSLWTLDVPKQ